MSLNSEITRITNAKAAIKTAIEGKGVTVGNGTIDTYAEKINQIKVDNGDFEKMINGTMTTLVIPDGVTSIRGYLCYQMKNLKNVVIPKSVEGFNGGVFYGSGITSISFHDDVSYYLGESLVRDCLSLTQVHLPETLTTLRYAFFNNCQALTSLTIPKNVTNIGGLVLNIGSSTNKATITMKPATPPAIATTTIGTNVTKILVPATSYNDYITAPIWSTYADIIVAEDPVESWFLSHVNFSSYGTEFQFPFLSNNQWYSKIKLVDGFGGGMWYDDTQVYYNDGKTVDDVTRYWESDEYKTIDLFQTPDASSDFAQWLEGSGVKLMEKWVLNVQPALPVAGDGQYQTFTSQFVSNNELLDAIRGLTNELKYGDYETEKIVYTVDPPRWTNEKYRTLQFVDAPYGDLLTWLQGNGTKQE